jgi:hypothetical protein
MTDAPFVRFSNEEDEIAEVLSRVQRVIEEHPVAVQAAFSALVREGRRFAATEDGAEWTRRLSHSELVSRLRILWESLSVTAFTDDPSATLPTFFLDGIVRAASDAGLESRLSKVFEER